MSGNQTGYRWFKWWIGGGALIAILLLTTAILNYQFVSRMIAMQQARQELSQEVVALEKDIRQASLAEGGQADPGLIRALISHAHMDAVAWIELRNGSDEVIAHSGMKLPEIDSPAKQREALRERRPTFRVRDTKMGRVVVESFGMLLPPAQAGARPQYGVLEMAMLIDQSATGVAWPALRNLLIEAAAAIALLIAMIVMALRFRAYANGQQLEQQVAIARQVQQDLLPVARLSAEGFDLSAECDQASEVGGDLYDIYAPAGAPEKTAFVVGDVSGKGLPASLLMGVLHGAVRASHWTGSRAEHQESTRQLNLLLCEHAAQERYATLFWSHYDPAAQTLRYVNAGHPPPLLVHKGQVQLLETGGPVLGLLPNARYEQGSVPFAEDDVLVMYSDGIIEAANPEGEEFGIERLMDIVAHSDIPADALRARILEDVRVFSKGVITDDRTLLVIRREADAVAIDPSIELTGAAA